MPTQTPQASTDPKTNHFLARLEQQDYDALMLVGKIVPLKFGKRMQLQDAHVSAVYFPLTCMFSILVTGDNKPLKELATVGKESIVGAMEVLQAEGAMGLSLVQIPGTALRNEAAAFLKVIGDRAPVQRLIYQHMYALLRQVLYGAACNRAHSMEERCARWLLMTHDRAGQDSFPLTQEFLSRMRRFVPKL